MTRDHALLHVSATVLAASTSTSGPVLGLAPLGLALTALLLAAARWPRPGSRPPGGAQGTRPSTAAARSRRRASRWAGRGAGALAAVTLAVAAGPVPAGAIGALLLASRWSSRRRAGRRHRRQVELALPDALDLFVVSLGAGLRPLECFELLAPLVPPVLDGPWRRVVDGVHRGGRFADAVAVLGDELGPDALAFASTLALTDAAGLALTPVVDRLADDARQQRRRAAEAAARELPVRLAFPLVLCTLPAFVLVAIVPLLLGALSSLRAT